MRKKTREFIQKSRESALLALDIYNRPATSFRSSGFIVMMVIAWTSLFHAIFEEQGVKYFYRKKDGKHYEYVDGEKKHGNWKLVLKIITRGKHLPKGRISVSLLV